MNEMKRGCFFFLL